MRLKVRFPFLHVECYEVFYDHSEINIGTLTPAMRLAEGDKE